MRCSLRIRLRKVKCSSWIRLKSPSKQTFRPSSQDLSIQNGTARGRDGYGTAHHPACARILPPTHHQDLATALERSATELRDPGPLRGIPRLHGVSRTHRQPLAMPLLGLGIWRHGLVAHKDLQSPQTVKVQRAVPIVVYPPAGPSRSRRDGGTRPARLCRLLWSLVFRRLFRLSRDSCRIRLQRDGPDPGSRLVPAIRPIGHRAEPMKAADNPISFAAGIAVVEQVVGVRVSGASRSDGQSVSTRQ